MNRINAIIVLCGFVIFTAGSCAGLPSRQKTTEKETTQTRIAEPITIVSRAETDPYSDSLMGKDLPDKVELFFFYVQDCEICNELDKFYDILSTQLPRDVRDTYPHMIYTINTVSAEGRMTYDRVISAMDLNPITLTPPLLIAGGRIFQGHETISNNIQEAFLTAGEDIFVNGRFYNPALRKTGKELFDDYKLKSGHVSAVYFHRIVCPDCKQVNPLINALPQTVTVEGKPVTLDLIRINTRSGNNSERVIAFFEKYQVPDADRQVPIIFFADGYLSGVEPILSQLTEKFSSRSDTDKLAELIPREEL